MHEGEDPSPAQTLRVENQELPDTLFGVLPKSVMWRFMKPFSNDLGMKLINSAKYKQGSTLGDKKTEHQSHAGFAFLLDYVPNWKWVYKPGGLIQYQSFVPRAAAAETFRAILNLTQRRGLPSYLGVTKRHRPDQFLFSHAVDGFSMALDFPVPRQVAALDQMAHELDQIVLEAGGRFYFAKDSTLTPYAAARYLGEATLARFHALKTRCDPQDVLQTELYRRVLAPAVALAATSAAAAGTALTLPERAPELAPAGAGAAMVATPGNGNGRHA